MRFLPIAVLALTPAWALAQERATEHFESSIRPILAGQCFKCHGGEKVSGKLRVDSRAALLAGGENGPAIRAGDAAGSLLMRVLRHADDAPAAMPPDEKLPAAAIAEFAAWIDAGAPWPEDVPGQKNPFASAAHWAFQPVRSPAIPAASIAGESSPIDRHLAVRSKDTGLVPQGPADKRTLVRRVFFDLIGLPPTSAEVEQFIADPAPDAWDRLVDRLLASPHYGERWGRHWMDVVRYADTAGDNADYPVPEAQRYRDYIIASLNADLPYDEFVREQLAGDLLAKANPEHRFAERTVATGFLALSRRYATGPYELWHVTLEDTIDTVGRTFLGLTLKCARCHDHKFDPVTSEDYYALYGIFASTQFPWAGAEEFASKQFPREHFAPLLPPERAEPLLAAHRQRLAELQAKLAELDKDPAHKPAADALRGELRNLQRTNLPPELPGAYAVQDGQPADVAIQSGGDPQRPGAIARRGTPRFLPGGGPLDIAEGQSGRRELADWLTRPDHPLTARVIANRLWQHHFGEGLVATPSNLGLRGAAPTHPELVDWLASELVLHGWSLKSLHRRMLASQAYRRSSADEERNLAIDPANRLYWRANRRRLEAEAVRDALLAASGTLDLRRPADHPFPPMSAWGWTQHTPFKDVYPSHHRSVYLMTQRIQRHPVLSLFDSPDANTSTDQRPQSIVPLQALFFMNSPLVKDESVALARRLMAVSSDDAHRASTAFALAYARPPSDADAEWAAAFLAQVRRELAAGGLPPDEVEREAWTAFARTLVSANEFLYID